MKAKKKILDQKPAKVEGKNFQLWCADAFDMLRLLPENSVDTICVDGPYNLSFMGKEFDVFKRKWKTFNTLPEEWIKKYG